MLQALIPYYLLNWAVMLLRSVLIQTLEKQYRSSHYFWDYKHSEHRRLKSLGTPSQTRSYSKSVTWLLFKFYNYYLIVIVVLRTSFQFQFNLRIAMHLLSMDNLTWRMNGAVKIFLKLLISNLQLVLTFQLYEFHSFHCLLSNPIRTMPVPQ